MVSAKRSLKCFIVGALIAIIVLSVIGGTLLYKPSIHTATYYEILSIQGVGEHKAQLIINYLDHNPNAVISDLQRISGIGTTIVERLEKCYR